MLWSQKHSWKVQDGFIVMSSFSALEWWKALHSLHCKFLIYFIKDGNFTAERGLMCRTEAPAEHPTFDPKRFGLAGLGELHFVLWLHMLSLANVNLEEEVPQAVIPLTGNTDKYLGPSWVLNQIQGQQAASSLWGKEDSRSWQCAKWFNTHNQGLNSDFWTLSCHSDAEQPQKSYF